jgi:hypothetical protein
MPAMISFYMITVYGERHFSCAFVLHVEKVVEGSYLLTDYDSHPCIIYGNSLPISITKVHEKLESQR